MLAEPEERMVYRLVDTEWIGYDGYADQQTNLDGVRFFAEKNAPSALRPNGIDPVTTFSDQQGNELHNRVQVQVTISPVVVPDREPVVYFRVFDPDHPGDSPFDPNILDFDPFTGLVPNDNVVAGGAPADIFPIDPSEANEIETGATIPASVQITVGSTIAKAIMTVDARQPGNNFIVGAGGRGDWLKEGGFDFDGVTIVRGNVSSSTENADRFVTPILVIWRSLYVEFDRMGQPGNGANAFTPNAEDEDPGAALQDLSGTLGALQAAFAPAMVEVRTGANADINLDPRDDAAFVHNLFHDEATGTASANPGNSVRDVTAELDFWSVQVFGAYEADQGLSNDPDTDNDWLLGTAYDRDDSGGPTTVYLETIRDVQADPGEPWCGLQTPIPPSLQPPPGLLTRVVVHEVLHRFNLSHGQPLGDEGPLNRVDGLCKDLVAPLTAGQLRRVQDTDKPR